VDLSTPEIALFPPIVQLVGLGLLSLYVIVSIIGRLSPRFRWLWRDPRKRHRLGHIVEYTLIPAAILTASSAAVVYNWDYRVPLDGGWATTDLLFGPGAALLGGLLIVVAGIAGRDADEMDPKALKSWLPFILVVSGIALMAVGVFRLGRVVKGRVAASSPRSSEERCSRPESGRPALSGRLTVAAEDDRQRVHWRSRG
jgi:hypothetical protein